MGFRPFVYKLAELNRLVGFVLNSARGVVIEVEGDEHSVRSFLDQLRSDPPPLARVTELKVQDIEAAGSDSFRIHSSQDSGGSTLALAPADVAVCAECLREMNDPGDRRYGYPFTNCTNCGPRYTIIRSVPYDRRSTSMAAFNMCAACAAEYHDARNRRFHAQPNACPECGPGIEFPGGIERARRLLLDGKIIAVKGLGGFHLVCDAENDAAVSRLRLRKRRSGKPFALMAADLAAAERICVLSDAARLALLSPQRPIVVLPRRPGLNISDAVAPGTFTLGVMLPYTPLHHLLLEGSPALVVMTSGNASEEPIVSRNEEAEPALGSVADEFLFHDRPIHTRVDDSVVQVFDDVVRVLRRSRGYAPQPVELHRDVVPVLACGGDLKNTFCLASGRHAFLSQHIGDLDNYETLAFFRETLERLQVLVRITPRVVACDLHPRFVSRRVAMQIDGVEHVAVQHHHAHIASCMAENQVRGKVIGVAMDGTGYGPDGGLWGGEFLLADYRAYERRAHFRYVPLAGGDAAVRQPWRAALAYLHDAGLPDTLPVPDNSRALVRAMIRKGINTVPTSSCGRLFDAVSSLIGLRQENTYEGQAAIELEQIAWPGPVRPYSFDITATEPWTVDLRTAISEITRDQSRGVPAGSIAGRFHNTVAALIGEVCRRLRASETLNRVCLSGGAFQNWLLLEKTVRDLRSSGFEVFLHALVPPGDGGIALGQAVIAAETVRFGT